MKKETEKEFTAKKVKELRENIDLSDVPEITDMTGFHLKNYKPVKKAISFRIELDNLDWLKRKGEKGYQKRINEVLRWAREHGCPLA